LENIGVNPVASTNTCSHRLTIRTSAQSGRKFWCKSICEYNFT